MTNINNFVTCRYGHYDLHGGQKRHFLWLGLVIVINFRRGAHSYQLLVAAIVDFFEMAAPENEGIYFVFHNFWSIWDILMILVSIAMF